MFVGQYWELVHRFISCGRLVRESSRQAYPQVLQTWEFEVDITSVGDLDTTQTNVFSYCNCLGCSESGKVTYRFEIAEIKTNYTEVFTETLLVHLHSHTKLFHHRLWENTIFVISRWGCSSPAHQCVATYTLNMSKPSRC
jgi:hypothetical protein